MCHVREKYRHFMEVQNVFTQNNKQTEVKQIHRSEKKQFLKIPAEKN
jgi:hypothetical protein